jgi:molybdopterin synthase sulfur carrier subunit
MQISLLAFGQVAGITGDNFSISEQVTDTDGLKALLQNRYPALGHIKYALAVNKKLVHENTSLNGDVTIALLPPFSGG